MKTKNIWLWVLLVMTIVSCKYDDSELWDKVNSLDNRVTSLEEKLTQMNSDINTISVIVNALQNKVYVENLTELSNGYQLKFSDGKTITIENGKDAPIISIDEYDGKYYWVQIVNDTKVWLTDKDGKKLPVTGEDAVTPILKISAEGYWLVSYDRGINFEQLKDENGNPVQAIGKDGADGTDGKDGVDGTDGKDGDSFFTDVKIEDNELVLTLTSGTVIKIPINDSTNEHEVEVQGSVEINNIEGLTISTLVEEFPLENKQFTIKTYQNSAPQLIYVSKGDDIIMMSREYADQNISINIRSTALAYVTSYPLFYGISSKEDWKTVIDMISNSSYFSVLENEVKKSIESRKDLFDAGNTSLLIALNNLLENLCSQESSMAFLLSRASINLNINCDPLEVTTIGNNVIIQNRGLTPTYQLDIYRGSYFLKSELVKSADSFGFLDFIKLLQGGNDTRLGDPVTFPLTEEGEYHFWYDRSTEQAINDFSLRLFSDALSAVGIDELKGVKINGKEADLSNLVNVFNGEMNVLSLLSKPDSTFKDWWDMFANWWIQYTMDAMEWKTVSKLFNKFNLVYNSIKGLGNEATRIVKGFAAPWNGYFCLCYYNGLITSCTETEIAKESGDGQEGFPNQRLLLPLVVSVKTLADDDTEIGRSPYQKIKFEVISGGGSVENEIVGTDAVTKTAETYWNLGASGEQKVRVVAVDMITGVEISQPIFFTAILKEAADITIRLDWNKLSGNTDIDLHTTDPFGEKIYYAHMQSVSGGWLDRDDVIGPGPEHIYWQNAPDGNYVVQVHYYGSESHAITSYRVTINIGDQTFGPYSGSIAYHQLITIGTIVMPERTVTRSEVKPTFIEKREILENYDELPNKTY